MNYENVFATIKSNLVPTSAYVKSNNEIFQLKLRLQNAKNDLKKMKQQNQDQQIAIDIFQAEKENLEVEKRVLEAQNKTLKVKLNEALKVTKTLKVKFNEVSLKLKHKNDQFDSLTKKILELKSKGYVIRKSNQKILLQPIDSQKIKEKSKEKGIVNFPSSVPTLSTPPKAKAGSKRKHSMISEYSPLLNLAFVNRRIENAKEKFTCEDCLHDWGLKIETDFHGDPNQKNAPDPKIRIFSTFEEYKAHVLDAHRNQRIFDLCGKKSCLRDRHHNGSLVRRGPIGYIDAPHGDKLCKICNLSFNLKEHLDRHVEVEHFCFEKSVPTKKKIFDLYSKYKL